VYENIGIAVFLCAIPLYLSASFGIVAAIVMFGTLHSSVVLYLSFIY